MATYDLETVIAQAEGKRVDLDPADSWFVEDPTCKISGQVELYGHGATVQHCQRWARQSAPLISGPYVTGVIDGLVLVGSKDPAQGYVASREGHAGFWFGAAHDLTLSNCQVLHVAGDFCYWGAYKRGNATTGITFDVCQRILLDNFIGIDAGRYAIAALGIGIPGLTIKANCVFKGWHSRTRIDREAWAGYKTPAAAVKDLGAYWQKKP